MRGPATLLGVLLVGSATALGAPDAPPARRGVEVWSEHSLRHECLGEAGTPCASPRARRLLVYGGRNHSVYLGCLSCDDGEHDSLLNARGRYGSKTSQASIWNPRSPYGSARSALSACDPAAADPPRVVDNRGTYYGRLTIDRARAIQSEEVLDWLASEVCRPGGPGASKGR